MSQTAKVDREGPSAKPWIRSPNNTQKSPVVFQKRLIILKKEPYCTQDIPIDP